MTDIKTNFLTLIGDLEKNDLVTLIGDLVENNSITVATQRSILQQFGLDVPPLRDDITPIANHNLKKIIISYQTNYNGCSVYCKEAADGTDPDVVNESEELEEISQIVGGAVSEYTYDNGMVDEDTCEFRGRTSDVEAICREFAQLYLGDVEVEFELDSSST